jgi:hypothetical protein
MKQRHVSSWWRQWTCVGGSCAPPANPAHTTVERALDRYVALTAPFLQGCLVFVVVGAVAFASFQLGPIAGLALIAGYLSVHGTYCLANFFRCREAHCIVTGVGWSVLALVAVGGVLAERDIRRAVWDAFLAVTIVGFAFEFVWTAVRGSNALRVP